MTQDEFLPQNFAEKNAIYLRVSNAITDLEKIHPIDLIVHTKSMLRNLLKWEVCFPNKLFARFEFYMKKLTEEWIGAAQDDLDVISRIIDEEHLSHIVAFHAQQCVEKLFKALAEEHRVELRKIHNLQHQQEQYTALHVIGWCSFV